MANPVATTNRAGYDQALVWAQQNLSAGVDSEVLVNGLMKQGWPEYDARMVLDNALNRPAMPPIPVTRPANLARPGLSPGVMSYASAKPDGQQAYRSAMKAAYFKRMMIGAAWFSVGVVVTVGSMAASANGGTYLLFWGPIIFGGYRMVTGFIGWVSN
jgi:hypothetical protein